MTKKTKKTLPRAARLALFAALAAGCATALQPTPGWGAATMSAEDCRELALEDLMQAINDGICTIDALPAAGPSQVANRGTTGSHNNDRDPPAGGGGSGGAGEGDDGEGDDGGDPPDNNDDGEGDDGEGDDGGDTGYNPCTCHHHGKTDASARSGEARDSGR
ncbi:MAG: hypothetical protein AB7S71_11435 [Dongiaceae bacterium]